MHVRATELTTTRQKHPDRHYNHRVGECVVHLALYRLCRRFRLKCDPARTCAKQTFAFSKLCDSCCDSSMFCLSQLPSSLFVLRVPTVISSGSLGWSSITIPRSVRTRTGGTPVAFTKFLRTGHKHVCPSTIASNVVHGHTQTKYCDYSALYGPLPHGDSVSCRVFYSSVLQRKFAIDPFASHITVTAQLYGRSFTPNVDGGVFGSQVSECFILDLLSQFLYSCPFCAQWKTSF